MPYPRKQAQAIFLNIKRRKGEGAAREFGRKHRSDFRKGNRRKRTYRRAS
jgi:hypothetical protein